jgi:desulfoferrodoxin-like iron-binding protein
MADYYKCENCNKFVKLINAGKGELTCCGKPMKLINEFKSSDDILDFAIKKEEEAFKFYNDWAQKVEKTWLQDVFKDFARDEQKHKEMLLKIKKGSILNKSDEKIIDLKISDYLVDLIPSPEMDYQHALIVAMKREKASFKLYTDLAKTTKDESLRSTFHILAQEEAKHKLKLETVYDKDILIWD